MEAAAPVTVTFTAAYKAAFTLNVYCSTTKAVPISPYYQWR